MRIGRNAAPETVQDVDGPLTRRLPFDGAPSRWQAIHEDVLCHAHALHEPELLVDHRDAIPLRLSGVRKTHRLAVDDVVAPIGLVNPHEDFHEHTLAGAVLAQHSMDFASAHLEAHVIKHCDPAKRLRNVRHPQGDIAYHFGSELIDAAEDSRPGGLKKRNPLRPEEWREP